MLFLCAVLAGQAAFAASLAFAANPQDEQTVRNAYAKLAYAVQSHTVYDAARKNPDITSAELTKELQANELRFDIAEMSSGPLSEIASKPYTDFVTPPDTQVVLQIIRDEEYFDENGKRVICNFAIPRWAPGEAAREGWNVPVQNAITQSGNGAKFSRYVTATITVRFKGQSRTYHTLWVFGSDTLAVDLVSGENVVKEFATESVFPSVLTDTSLRTRAAVSEWLNSTQRFDPSCKTGKQDVCCDSAMLCGVAADDLRSTKAAPNTRDIPKGGL
jgi:hypothetical protein